MPQILTNIVQNINKQAINVVVSKKILVLGAGRSSTYLIEYLLNNSMEHHWEVTIADLQLSLALEKTANHPAARAIALDLNDTSSLKKEVERATVVVSLLPADLHIHVAELCLIYEKSLFTASYVSEAMKQLDAQVQAKNLLFLNEIGCDPGIDHMSTMAMIEEIRTQGGTIHSLHSYTGGLIAPAFNTNPWHYKFSWNPRNVVLAAQPGPARYLANGYIRYKPYGRIFRETERIDVPGFGQLEAYANRDSLPYKALYDLHEAQTILRATFRYPDFCLGWNVLVQLGLTNDTLQLENCDQLSYRDFLNMFLPPDESPTVKAGLIAFLRDKMLYDEQEMAVVIAQFEHLDFFSSTTFAQKADTPANLLLTILQNKWSLDPKDKDLIVMHHEIGYFVNDQKHLKTSTLILEGENDVHTAMAKTVGLPLAMAVKMFLLGQIQEKGVRIPTSKSIYGPILNELAHYGVEFKEHYKEQ